MDGPSDQFLEPQAIDARGLIRANTHFSRRKKTSSNPQARSVWKNGQIGLMLPGFSTEQSKASALRRKTKSMNTYRSDRDDAELDALRAQLDEMDA